MYLFNKIEEMSIIYNDSRRSIGEFLLNNRAEIHEYTMVDIAKETYTSKASLVRFAQQLGYSGWKEFIYEYIHETVHNLSESENYVNPDFPFKNEDDTSTIIENISLLQIQSIQETVSNLEIKDVEKAAKILLNSNRIAILGNIPNSYYGEIFKRKLLSLNKSASVYQRGESGIVSLNYTKNDCVILISYSGNNEKSDPIRNIKYLKQNNVPIIAITSKGENFLSINATVTLQIGGIERLTNKISNFSSEQSILTILNILYSKLFSFHYEENKINKINNSYLLEKNSRLSNYIDL